MPNKPNPPVGKTEWRWFRPKEGVPFICRIKKPANVARAPELGPHCVPLVNMPSGTWGRVLVDDWEQDRLDEIEESKDRLIGLEMSVRTISSWQKNLGVDDETTDKIRESHLRQIEQLTSRIAELEKGNQ